MKTGRIIAGVVAAVLVATASWWYLLRESPGKASDNAARSAADSVAAGADSTPSSATQATLSSDASITAIAPPPVESDTTAAQSVLLNADAEYWMPPSTSGEVDAIGTFVDADDTTPRPSRRPASHIGEFLDADDPG